MAGAAQKTPDPTENVLALVEAAVRRLDDLREAETGKREAISRHLHEIIDLRATHAQQLREAEAKRIDAIREVDVQAAKAVATQAATTAETLRALVESTAKALAAEMAARFAEVSARLSQLERSSYEGAGKGGGQKAVVVWIFSGIIALGAVVAMAITFAR